MHGLERPAGAALLMDVAIAARDGLRWDGNGSVWDTGVIISDGNGDTYTPCTLCLRRLTNLQRLQVFLLHM